MEQVKPTQAQENKGLSIERGKNRMVDMMAGIRNLGRNAVQGNAGNDEGQGGEQREPGYYVMSDSWPVHVQRDSLTVEQIDDVLNSFDDVYDAAMRGLANTAVENKPE